jgi:putative transposase
MALHRARQTDAERFIESFNGRLRDELLNETLFSSLPQARTALANWRVDYNTARPHSQLGWQTPTAFASTFTPRRALTLRYATSTAPELVASPARTGSTTARNELSAG